MLITFQNLATYNTFTFDLETIVDVSDITKKREALGEEVIIADSDFPRDIAHFSDEDLMTLKGLIYDSDYLGSKTFRVTVIADILDYGLEIGFVEDILENTIVSTAEDFVYQMLPELESLPPLVSGHVDYEGIFDDLMSCDYNHVQVDFCHMSHDNIFAIWQQY